VSAALERFARRLWDGDAGLSAQIARGALAPLAAGYGLAVRTRNARYDGRPGLRVEGLRIVSVGNLVVGGTGKTPFSAWAARRLCAAGESAAVVCGGYGRDEPLLHERWNRDIPVHVGADRVQAAGRAADGGAGVVVLDDGFQHRRLARDLDVVLLSAGDGYPGPLLPRGPYREPTGSLARAHVVIVTRRAGEGKRAQSLAARVAAEHPHLVVGRVCFGAPNWQSLGGEALRAPSGPGLLACGIARPAAFAADVAALLGTRPELVPFADHHEYTRADVEALRRRAGQRPVVVTEKDAVKLSGYASHIPGAYVLAQAVLWEGGEDRVTEMILKHGERRR